MNVGLLRKDIGKGMADGIRTYEDNPGIQL